MGLLQKIISGAENTISNPGKAIRNEAERIAGQAKSGVDKLGHGISVTGKDAVTGATRAARTAAAQGTSAIKNPSQFISDADKASSFYQTAVRPAAKIGSGALAGYVTSGLNPMGALAGGLTSAALGGTTSDPYQPLNDIVAPGLVGYAMAPSSAPAAGATATTSPWWGVGASALGGLASGMASNGAPAYQPSPVDMTNPNASVANPLAALSSGLAVDPMTGGSDNMGSGTQQDNTMGKGSGHLKYGVNPYATV